MNTQVHLNSDFARKSHLLALSFEPNNILICYFRYPHKPSLGLGSGGPQWNGLFS